MTLQTVVTIGDYNHVAIKAFQTIHTRDNPDLDRIQSNVEIFTRPLTNLPLLDGRLIEDITLSTSETLVDHKLGRAYRGWIIVDKDAIQDVYVSSAALPERFLALTAGGAVTVALWVF